MMAIPGAGQNRKVVSGLCKVVIGPGAKTTSVVMKRATMQGNMGRQME